MNNYLNYYYKLYPDEVHQYNDFFYFHLNDEKYYLVVYNRSIEDIGPIFELNVEMINRNMLVHEIILNKDNQPLTFINNIPYILFKVYVNEYKKVNLAEIDFINKNSIGIKLYNVLDRTNWTRLWSEKIDYFEYQISHIGKQYPILCESLSYFIGLGENAISFVNNTYLELSPTIHDQYTVSHKRIKSYFTMFDLYNPLSFIIDYQVRDFCEYIKEAFFTGDNVWPYINEYFKHNNLSVFSMRLLFGRLLFPSYYFDFYEQIIEGNKNEYEILPLIAKVSEYEVFLKEFYQYIAVNYNIPPITWLNKINITN